ncbi:MAG TPA: antibiotic biosynthesis monooxygenase [Rhodobacteraceae bacterium]|nr:antibiotic biosynthesis monooxygenase [Paracoccaceae bacterium]
MLTISKNDQVQTVITTFDVTPANCDELLEVLKEACDSFVSKQAGFIGAAIHVNDARTRIANYTQWKNRDDFQAMLRSEGMQMYHQKINELCKSFAPVLYDVVSSVG